MSNPFKTDAFRILFRFAGLSAIFYGAFIWIAGSFSGPSAFSLYASAPTPAFSVPLIVGGATQFLGCLRYNRWVAITGAAMAMCIFLTAEFSCLLSQPRSTGVPAYGIIVGFYLLMIYCVMCTPLPCAPASRK